MDLWEYALLTFSIAPEPELGEFEMRATLHEFDRITEYHDGFVNTEIGILRYLCLAGSEGWEFVSGNVEQYLQKASDFSFLLKRPATVARKAVNPYIVGGS